MAKRAYKYLITNVYGDAVLICDTRADAEEMCLAFAEDDAFLDYYCYNTRIDGYISGYKSLGYQTSYGCLLCKASTDDYVWEVPYIG